jgi:nuclear cap-binding protein subunit 2
MYYNKIAMGVIAIRNFRLLLPSPPLLTLATMELFDNAMPAKIYYDRKTFSSFEEHVAALRGSSTVYVGNLAFATTEIQVKEVFSAVGPVKRVIMGLDRVRRTPCGFCFVEFFASADAAASVNYLSDTAVDDQIIRVELDPGFRPGRQFGRGIKGGQVRDERRKTVDKARVAPELFDSPYQRGSGKRGREEESEPKQNEGVEGEDRARDDDMVDEESGGGKRQRRGGAEDENPPPAATTSDEAHTPVVEEHEDDEEKIIAPDEGS